MNRAPFEDLHNTLLDFQDLAFFEEIHKKASHDQIRECYDDLEVVKLGLKHLKTFSQSFRQIHFFTQHIITLI